MKRENSKDKLPEFSSQCYSCGKKPRKGSGYFSDEFLICLNCGLIFNSDTKVYYSVGTSKNCKHKLKKLLQLSEEELRNN